MGSLGARYRPGEFYHYCSYNRDNRVLGYQGIRGQPVSRPRKKKRLRKDNLKTEKFTQEVKLKKKVIDLNCIF